MNENKNTIINDIKKLIATNKNDAIEICSSHLQYFSIEELEDIRDTLVLKKSDFRENNELFLNELYEKTKKDGGNNK